MRDALLMVVVGVIAVMAVFSPRYGLWGYIWFSLFRPDILAFSPQRPYSMVLAVVTGVSALRAIPRAMALLGNPFIWLFLAYQVWSGFSVLAAQSVDLCFPAYTYFVTFSVICMAIPLLMENGEHLRLLMLVLGGSVGLLGTKLGVYGVLAGGARFSQGYGGQMNDNNLLALAFVTSVPLIWYGVRLTQYMPLKGLFAFMLLMTLAAIAMCHSRGGILSLAVVMVLLAWRSKKRLQVFALLAALALPGVWLVRDSLFDRMATLGAEQLDASAAGRLAFWKAALRVSRDYPVFGLGFGGTNYTRVADQYVQGDFAGSGYLVHNTYLQMLADSGYPTVLFYCMLLFGALWWVKKHAERIREQNRELSLWADGLWISLAGYSLGSAFLSRVTFDYPYMLIMTAAAFYQIEKMTAPVAEARPAVAAGQTQAAAPAIPANGWQATPGTQSAEDAGVPAWKRPGAGRRMRSRQGP